MQDLDLTHNRIRTIQGLDLGKFKALKVDTAILKLRKWQ